MPEHVHEWKIRGAGFRCKDFPKCPVQLSNEEAEARLNATERLKVLIANLMAESADGPNEMGGPFIAISVIASTLEE